jgi:hypothetical protein
MERMMNEGTPYWQDVRQAVNEVIATVTGQSQQPKDPDAVYLVSILKRGSDPQRRVGVLSLAPLKIAAQRLVEGTHAVATDDQIVAYEKDQAEKRKTMQSLAATGKNSLIFAAEPKLVTP